MNLTDVDPHNGPFTPLHDHVARVPGLSHAARRLYGALARIRGKGPGRECAPTIKRLCHLLGVSDERELRRLIRELEGRGLIAVDRSLNGRGKPSRYTFQHHDWFDSQEPPGTNDPRVQETPGSSTPSGTTPPDPGGTTPPDPGGTTPPDPGGTTPPESEDLLDQNLSQEPSRRKKRTSTARDVVFEHWIQVMTKDAARVVLNGERLKKLKARRAEGYTDAQLCRAVDGCKLSAWHMGENDRGEVYDDLATILRDGTTVEKHIARAEQGGPRFVLRARPGRIAPAPGTTAKDFEGSEPFEVQLARLSKPIGEAAQ